MATNPAVGAWSLESLRAERFDGTVTYPLGEDATGSIIYTESGRFSAQLMRAGRSHLAANDPSLGTPDEITANDNGMISYFGHYDLGIEKGTITPNVETSWFPNFHGTALVRHFELDGDRLNFTTAPVQLGGTEIVGKLVWDRA